MRVLVQDLLLKMISIDKFSRLRSDRLLEWEPMHKERSSETLLTDSNNDQFQTHARTCRSYPCYEQERTEDRGIKSFVDGQSPYNIRSHTKSREMIERRNLLFLKYQCS